MSLDDKSKITLRVLWVLIASVATETFFVAGIFYQSNANANSITQINAQRESRHDNFVKEQKDFMLEFGAFRQEVKGLTEEVKELKEEIRRIRR